MLITATDAACVEAALRNPGVAFSGDSDESKDSNGKLSVLRTSRFSCDLMSFICMCYYFS